MTGKVWVLGDDIDTDIIIPTEYLALKTIDDMKQYGFSRSARSWLPRSSPVTSSLLEKLRLRFFQRTGTGDHQSVGNPVRDCEILREDLLPQLH